MRSICPGRTRDELEACDCDHALVRVGPGCHDICDRGAALRLYVKDGRSATAVRMGCDRNVVSILKDLVLQRELRQVYVPFWPPWKGTCMRFDEGTRTNHVRTSSVD